MKTRNHNFSTFLSVLISAASLWVSSIATGNEKSLPDLGTSSANVFTRSEIKDLGKEFLGTIYERTQIMQDPLVNDYIQHLGHRLIANSNVDRHANPYFNFFIVNEPTINAFAGPDGHIGIHSGLIMESESEHELASVLAHELAHVSQNHIARLYEDAKLMTIPTIAGMLASVALATQDAQAGNAALVAMMAGSSQWGVNRIRHHEKEADRVGIRILSEAGFDPQGMPDFFERLQKMVNRFDSQVLPPILMTHPVTEFRIADSRNRVAQLPKRKYTSSQAYALVKARLRVSTDKEPQRLENVFKKESYGRALLLLRQRKLPVAEKIANRLFKKEPDNLFYRLLLVDIKLEANKDAEAINLLAEGREYYPQSYPLNVQYIKALMSANNHKAAKAMALSQVRHDQGKSPLLFQLLSETQAALGFVAEAHQARAEQLVLLGQDEDAVTQLKYAEKVQDLTDDQKIEIAARIGQLEKHTLGTFPK